MVMYGVGSYFLDTIYLPVIGWSRHPLATQSPMQLLMCWKVWKMRRNCDTEAVFVMETDPIRGQPVKHPTDPRPIAVNRDHRGLARPCSWGERPPQEKNSNTSHVQQQVFCASAIWFHRQKNEISHTTCKK